MKYKLGKMRKKKTSNITKANQSQQQNILGVLKGIHDFKKNSKNTKKTVLELIRSGEPKNIRLAFNQAKAWNLDINEIAKPYLSLNILSNDAVKLKALTPKHLITLFTKKKLVLDFDYYLPIFNSFKERDNLLKDVFSEIFYLKNLHTIEIFGDFELWNTTINGEKKTTKLPLLKLPENVKELEFWGCQLDYKFSYTKKHLLNLENVKATDFPVSFINNDTKTSRDLFGCYGQVNVKKGVATFSAV